MFSKFLFGVAAMATLFSNASADNDYPVVLVHGLAGTADGWEYIPEIEEAGLQTIALDLYKFTSAWERACQIYAQLKGTVTDFGVCRSNQFGHDRFGPDYTGQALYPEWDEDHPIHLWGHSYGGPTITALEMLLREGSGCPQDTSELLVGGGKNWIRSMTSFSGVLGGTTLVDILDRADLLDFIVSLVLFAAGLIDNTFVDDLFTIDFEHWGIERIPGESFQSYWNRVQDSGIMDDNDSLAPYDLSIEGARANNAMRSEIAYPGTYYYAIANEDTYPDRDCFLFFWCDDWEEDPEASMFIFLWPTADQIGETGAQADRKNDGLVNWRNMMCPIVDDSDRSECVEFSGTWTPGQWFYQDVNFLDHLQTTSRDVVRDNLFYGTSAKKIYVDHAARTKALP